MKKILLLFVALLFIPSAYSSEMTLFLATGFVIAWSIVLPYYRATTVERALIVLEFCESYMKFRKLSLYYSHETQRDKRVQGEYKIKRRVIEATVLKNSKTFADMKIVANSCPLTEGQEILLRSKIYQKAFFVCFWKSLKKALIQGLFSLRY